MRQLSTFGGMRILLEDDEAENVKRLWVEDSSIPIELRDGTMVNPKAIEAIGEVETTPFFNGNKMNNGMTRVLVDGVWKNFCGKREDIEHRIIAKNNFKRIETHCKINNKKRNEKKRI